MYFSDQTAVTRVRAVFVDDRVDDYPLCSLAHIEHKDRASAFRALPLWLAAFLPVSFPVLVPAGGRLKEFWGVWERGAGCAIRSNQSEGWVFSESEGHLLAMSHRYNHGRKRVAR